MGAQLGRLRYDKVENVAVHLVFIVILTGFLPQYVEAENFKYGCSRKFNNTYLISPTLNILKQPPKTIMFWMFALDDLPSSYDIYAGDTPTLHKTINNADTNDNSTAILFNTGDFVDPECSCNKRLVIVYRYDNSSVEAQLWVEDGNGNWICEFVTGQGSISLATWYHVIFYLDTLSFVIKGQVDYSGNVYNSTTTTDPTPSNLAVIGQNFLDLDELRVYYNDAYRGDLCIGMNACWSLSSLCNSTTISNLAVYFNFDECLGVSAHNMGGANVDHSCWACKDLKGNSCPSGNNSQDWPFSIVESKSCTAVGSTCAGSTSMLIPIAALVGLACGLLASLLVCVGLAAYLGKKYRVHTYQSVGTTETGSPPLLTLTEPDENEPISILSPHFPLAIGPPPGLDAIVPYLPRNSQSRTPSPISPLPLPSTDSTPSSVPSTTVTSPRSNGTPTTPRTAAVASLIATAFIHGHRVNSPTHSLSPSSSDSFSIPSSDSSVSPSSSPDSPPSPSSSPRLIRSRTAPPPAPASAPAAPIPSPSMSTLSPESIDRPRKTISVECVSKHTPPLPPHHGPLRKTTSTGQFQYLPPTSTSTPTTPTLTSTAITSTSTPFSTTSSSSSTDISIPSPFLPRKSPSSDSIYVKKDDQSVDARSYFDADSPPPSGSPNPPTPSISINSPTTSSTENVFFNNTPIGNILNTPESISVSSILSSSSSTPVSKHVTSSPTINSSTQRFLSSSVPTTPPRYLPAYVPTPPKSLNLSSEFIVDFSSTNSSSSSLSPSASHITSHLL